MWLAKLVDLTSRVSCLEEIQTVLYQDAVAISEMPSLQKKLDEIFGVPTTDLFTLTLAELTDRLAKKGRLEVFREQHPTLCTSVDTYVTSVKSYPRAQFATPDTSDTLPPQSVRELKNLMDSELERIGVSGLWSVKIDTTGKYHRVLVFYKKKVIILPVTESFLKNKIAYSVTGRKAARLLVHEISTHVIRSTNGYFSKLKLLSVGLDRYTSGEEGVATFREQRAFGSSTYFAGFESYLAIGLAYGMDRLGLERTPHELYRLLLEINRALHGQSSLLVQYRAWKRVLRTYIFLPHNTF